ncbi:MAG TPA: hypothetical protein VHT03_12255 [Rhizomicrobium sp.]|nr:hypothetical protein [Rhizomicrobium sp.]
MIASGFSPASPRAARHKLPERATAVALLILLHAALFHLIQSEFGVRTGRLPLNEIVLSFTQPNSRETVAPVISPVFVRPHAPVLTPPVIAPTGSRLPLQPPIAAPDITGVGRSLFGCDLVNGRNLSTEQTANCRKFGRAPPDTGSIEAGMPKGSKARHSTLWAAELAARRTPPEVPCTHVEQQVLGGPGVEKPVTTLMADPLCLLKGWLNGFHDQPK